MKRKIHFGEEEVDECKDDVPMVTKAPPIVRVRKRRTPSASNAPIQKSLDNAMNLMDELLRSAGDMLPSR